MLLDINNISNLRVACKERDNYEKDLCVGKDECIEKDLQENAFYFEDRRDGLTAHIWFDEYTEHDEKWGFVFKDQDKIYSFQEVYDMAN